MAGKPTYEELEQRVKELEKDSIVHRQIEEALRESEDNFRGLYEGSRDAIGHSDMDGRLLETNKAFQELTGYSAQELSKMTYQDLTPKKWQKIETEVVKESVDKKYLPLLEKEYRRKDGTIVPIELSGFTSKIEEGRSVSMWAFIRDISDRKKTEDKLKKHQDHLEELVKERTAELSKVNEHLQLEMEERKQAEERLLQESTMRDILLDNLPCVALVLRKETREIVSSNKAAKQMGAVPGKTCYETCAERDDNCPFCLAPKLWATGESQRVEVEYRGTYYEGIWVPLTEDLYVHYIFDITERKRAEDGLRESEEKYRQLSDSLPQIVFETNEKGNLTFTNRVAFDILGYTREDFEKGLNALQMLIPEDHDRALKNIQRVLKGEKLGGTEYTALTKKGRTYPVMVFSTAIIREGKSVGMRGIVADLTELKRTQKALQDNEEKLARSRKMEAMGLMAGGVAHDLNNILSGIVSYPELLLLDLPEDSPLRNPIKTIQESGMRAADVVEDLLTIARGVATGKEALNLNTLITEYLGSAEYEKLEKTHSFVSCRTELDPDLLNMSGSPTHIKKILMNLIANATEAIEGSGTVTISTTSQYLDEPLKGYEDVHIGEYVVLTISDDGSGISPGDLERIFEPFYTKKMMGRSGTGLGLAVVWNTVQDHNGYINVKSSEKGTEFELYFPVTRDLIADDTISPVLSRARGKVLQLHPRRLGSAASSTFATLGNVLQPNPLNFLRTSSTFFYCGHQNHIKRTNLVDKIEDKRKR